MIRRHSRTSEPLAEKPQALADAPADGCQTVNATEAWPSFGVSAEDATTLETGLVDAGMTVLVETGGDHQCLKTARASAKL